MDMIRRNLLTSSTLAPLALLPSAADLVARPILPGKPIALPNVRLVTQDKRRVRFYSDLVRGNRIVLINFMYAQCSEICPGMTANLVEVQRVLGKRVGRDVFMYSISLLPEQDGPEVLAAYAQGLGVGPGWTFLTGQGPDIETLRRALGYADPNLDVDRDITQHIGMLRIGNDALGRWMACPALARPSQIAQEAMWIGMARRA